MFCPKCGNESPDGQRFCKACGANLQLVSNALGQGDDTLGQLRVDVEGLKRSIKEGLNSIKYNKYNKGNRYQHHRQGDFWSKWVYWEKPGSDAQNAGRPSGATTKEISREQSAATQVQPQNTLPLFEPGEWLPYSRQHSMMRGLGSLFAGAAMGAVFYFLGRQLIDSGTISDLEALARIHGLANFVSLFWIVSAIPVAKGLSQIFYGIFFAESIKTMTTRFMQAVTYNQASLSAPPVAQPEPVAQAPVSDFQQSPPPSVTEQTTNILGRQGIQNAQ